MAKEYTLEIEFPDTQKEPGPGTWSVRDALPHEVRGVELPLRARVRGAYIFSKNEPGQRYSQGGANKAKEFLKSAFPEGKVTILPAPQLH